MFTEEQTELIAKNAEMLLNVSNDLKNIHNDYAFDSLLLSNRVLKLIENNDDCDCKCNNEIPINFNSEIDKEIDSMVDKIKLELGE